jgi:hypothetical protein
MAVNENILHTWPIGCQKTRIFSTQARDLGLVELRVKVLKPATVTGDQ